MKIRLVFLSAAVAATAFTFQGCLKDQADIFEETSSTRTSEMIAQVKSLLTSAENGWSMTYYPGATATTSTFVLSFTADAVTATNEVDTTLTVKSLYKIDDNDGPVLSFDSYNSVLHKWATPSSSAYQAQGGDFEFKIMDLSENRIVLKGRRSGNTCVMEPLQETPSQFFKGILSMGARFSYAAFSCTITGGAVEGFLDQGTRTLSIGRKGADDDELTTVRYVVTKTGIHLHNPIEINGVILEDFDFDPETDKLTASGITMNKVIPEGWVSYQDFLGDYTLSYYSGTRSFQVSLVEKEKGISFEMEGLSTYFKPSLGYNSGRGRLTWNNQALGANGANTVVLAGWNYPASTSLWPYIDDGVGMIGIVVDNSVSDFEIEFVDNGIWTTLQSGKTVQGWVLWQLDGDGNSAGQFEDWTMASGNAQLPGLITMQKIVE